MVVPVGINPDEWRRALGFGVVPAVTPTILSDTVAVAPSPADSGLTMDPTDDTLFPDPSSSEGSFYAILCPVGVIPTPQSAEIVLVTALAAGTWTIERALYGTQALDVAVGWVIKWASDASALDLLAYLGTQSPPLNTVSVVKGNATAVVFDLGEDYVGRMIGMRLTATDFVPDGETFGASTDDLNVIVTSFVTSFDGQKWFAVTPTVIGFGGTAAFRMRYLDHPVLWLLPAARYVRFLLQIRIGD